MQRAGTDRWDIAECSASIFQEQEEPEPSGSLLIRHWMGYDVYEPLGMSVTQDEAMALAFEYRSQGRRVWVIEARYVTGGVSSAAAMAIARQWRADNLDEIREKHRDDRWPEIAVGHPVRADYYIEAYGFSMPVREWVEAGYVPGVIAMHVDRRDGHVWDEGEKEAARLRRLATL